MSKLVFTILILFSNLIFCQEVKYNEITKEGIFTKYISKKDLVFIVGENIEIGLPWNKERFTYILQGNQNVDAKLTFIKLKIEKIEVIKMQNGFFKPFIFCKGFGSLPIQIDIEPALETNEIIK